MTPITSFSSSQFSPINVEDSPEHSAATLVNHGSSLEIRAPSGKDYWSRTFYEPLLRKADAPALLAEVPPHAEATLELAFTLSPVEQFDQAGVLVFVDEDTWVKAGIEFCDRVPRLSCVVTNNGFSDWSTQVIDTCSARIRVHKVLGPGTEQGPAMVMEVGEGSTDRCTSWAFVRIAPLRSGHKPWRMGPFAACPLRQSGSMAMFHSIYLGPKLEACHSSNPGHS